MSSPIYEEFPYVWYVRLLSKVTPWSPQEIYNWYYIKRKQWCWTDKRFTNWYSCVNCYKWYCLKHAEKETEYEDFGSIIAGPYTICPHCR